MAEHKGNGARYGAPPKQHRPTTSLDSLTTSNSSIADTPISSSASLDTGIPSQGAAGWATQSGVPKAPMRRGLSCSASLLSTPVQTQEHQQQPEVPRGRAKRTRILAPSLCDLLCEDAGGDGGEEERGSRSNRAGGNGNDEVELNEGVTSVGQQQKPGDTRKGEGEGFDDLRSPENAQKDFRRRVEAYREKHSLQLAGGNLCTLSQSKPLPERNSKDDASPAAGSPRSASPRVWPAISPVSYTLPHLGLFSPTLTHSPVYASGGEGWYSQGRHCEELREAPPGSVVSAIRTKLEKMHPTVAELEKRRDEGKLCYPSCMSFGYPVLSGGGGMESSGASQRSGSMALRCAESGTSARALRGSPRSAPVMSSVEAEAPARRGHHPIDRILAQHWQRVHERAQLGAAARERTHRTILRSHHVPLVPFSTQLDEHSMPLAAPTVEEAVTSFEYDGDGHHYGGFLLPPHKLHRAMTRESVRPKTPAINVSSIGVGGKLNRKQGTYVFEGVTKYEFGRRAGGGPMGGGRSTFLNEADPSQFWAAQLSAQTHLHLDPLFPEELLIDDMSDDYYCGGGGLGSAQSPKGRDRSFSLSLSAGYSRGSAMASGVRDGGRASREI